MAHQMKKQLKTALVLLGHGSHISANTAGVVWDAVDNLRQLGIADEITAAFWKEQPSFHGVLSSISATDITLIPLFTAQGYFTQTVIPTEMGLSGKITPRDGRTIRYAQPPVFHPKIQQIVQARVDNAIQQYRLNPSEIGIAIIGHSTRKNPKSREATEYQAQILREKGVFGAVITAFLDDDPEISTIYDRISQPTIIAIPLFLAMGSHTTIDVPEALSLPPNQNNGIVNSKQVIYTPSIGDGQDFTDLILDLAHDVDAPLYEPHPQKNGWDGFPQGGWDAFKIRLHEHDTLNIGGLIIRHNRVEARSQDEKPLRQIFTPAELRQMVRGTPFRPLPTSYDLPSGWYISTQSLDEVCAVIETVYPALIPHIAPDASYSFTPLAQTLARQTGIYRDITQLDEKTIADITQGVCSGCIKHPTWHNDISSPIACDEACNWWLSDALKRIKNDTNNG